MRKAILIVSSGVALFFAASFALTFFARGYITGLAQDFVIDKTKRYAEPTVEVAEQALRAPGINLVLNNEAIQTAQSQIADYRRDPHDYIAGLVAGKRVPIPAVVPVQDTPLQERTTRWKAQIRDYFERTMDRLIRDLRIFCGTNLVAALIAIGCAARAGVGRINWLLGAAGLLLVSVAYGAYMYVDGLTYFRILFNTHLGWWYPAFLGITFLGLYLEYGRRDQRSSTQLSQAIASEMIR